MGNGGSGHAEQDRRLLAAIDEADVTRLHKAMKKGANIKTCVYPGQQRPQPSEGPRPPGDNRDSHHLPSCCCCCCACLRQVSIPPASRASPPSLLRLPLPGVRSCAPRIAVTTTSCRFCYN